MRTSSDLMARSVFYTPVKRSHMIAPFGVGALMLARSGVGVVVCGLDEWLRERPRGNRLEQQAWLDANQIFDEHLQRRLGVNRLIQPPPLADDPNEHNTWFVRVARFPLTEYCINPKCRMLITRAPEGVSEGRCAACEPEGGKQRAWPTQQVPLVLACPAGHLSDITWVEWAHNAELQPLNEQGESTHPGGLCTRPSLTYRVSTNITAPVVECTCGAGVDLGQVRYHKHACPGSRPWLPGTANDACTENAQVLERTSTNLYYPDVRSALYLPHGPEVDHRLMAVLSDRVARLLLSSYDAGSPVSDVDLRRLVEVGVSRGVETTPEEIARHLEVAATSSEDVEEAEVRRQELEALLDGTPKTSSNAGMPPLIVRPIDTTDFDGGSFRERIEAVSAVERLTETRALVGFARLEPQRLLPADGFEQLWGRPLDALEERDWLVAHRVYGEGILLVLDQASVAGWEEKLSHSSAWFRNGFDGPGGFQTPRLLLAHTLAHAVLREAASICGYPLPALRERIYDITDEDGGTQTALLVYTAEGDAYGTLGGLVELAQPGNLEELVSRAVEQARWCGADPVCMTPPEKAGLQTSPGSCHHCLLLPETSCELFNQWLDRAALVGGRSDIPAFF